MHIQSGKVCKEKWGVGWKEPPVNEGKKVGKEENQFLKKNSVVNLQLN
jgi:hypothetical protein